MDWKLCETISEKSVPPDAVIHCSLVKYEPAPVEKIHRKSCNPHSSPSLASSARIPGSETQAGKRPSSYVARGNSDFLRSHRPWNRTWHRFRIVSRLGRWIIEFLREWPTTLRGCRRTSVWIWAPRRKVLDVKAPRWRSSKDHWSFLLCEGKRTSMAIGQVPPAIDSQSSTNFGRISASSPCKLEVAIGTRDDSELRARKMFGHNSGTAFGLRAEARRSCRKARPVEA